MNLFKTTTFAWWQVGALKACVWCFGLSAGAYFSDRVLPYISYLLPLGVVLALYLVYVWAKE